MYIIILGKVKFSKSTYKDPKNVPSSILWTSPVIGRDKLNEPRSLPLLRGSSSAGNQVSFWVRLPQMILYSPSLRAAMKGRSLML